MVELSGPPHFRAKASIKIYAIYSIRVLYRKNLRCGLGFELLLLSFDPSVKWPKIGSVIERVVVSLGMLFHPSRSNSRFDRHQSKNSSSRILKSVATNQCKQCSAYLNSNANSWDLCSFSHQSTYPIFPKKIAFPNSPSLPSPFSFLPTPLSLHFSSKPHQGRALRCLHRRPCRFVPRLAGAAVTAAPLISTRSFLIFHNLRKLFLLFSVLICLRN
jgi:hypothetical protein